MFFFFFWNFKTGQEPQRAQRTSWKGKEDQYAHHLVHSLQTFVSETHHSTKSRWKTLRFGFQVASSEIQTKMTFNNHTWYEWRYESKVLRDWLMERKWHDTVYWLQMRESANNDPESIRKFRDWKNTLLFQGQWRAEVTSLRFSRLCCFFPFNHEGKFSRIQEKTKFIFFATVNIVSHDKNCSVSLQRNDVEFAPPEQFFFEKLSEITGQVYFRHTPNIIVPPHKQSAISHLGSAEMSVYFTVTLVA